MAARRWWGAKGSGSRRELQDTNKAEDVLEGLDEFDLSKRPEVRIINRYVRIRTCIMLVFKAVGSLALLWSTVVLLGGFVTLLKKVDFWYLTFIGFVQAAGIFNALADDQFIFIISFLLSPIAKVVSWIEELQKHMLSKSRRTSAEEKVPMPQAFLQAFYEISVVIMQIFMLILHLPVIFLSFGLPIICLILSSSRLGRQDYGSADGDASKANLKPALNIFYSLAVAQSVLYMIWISVESMVPALTLQLFNNYGYEEEAMDDYITETKRKCIRDMALGEDWNLITYALRLLDSESLDSDDYCSGLRILQALIEEKVPVSQLLIRSSRQRIRNLIRTLGWRRPTDRETRELAARILAHLASDLSLSDFPGALESISSLLEIQDQESLYFPLRKNRRRNTKKSALEIMVVKVVGPKSLDDLFLGYEQGIIKIREGTKEELILQGLRIVENLAHNERNCTEIYKSKDLLLKITAPVSSDKFIEEVKTNGGCSVRVMDGTLKVVRRLVSAHGDIGKNMRLDIANTGRKDVSSSKENMTFVSNLVAILGLKGNEPNNNILGLQIRAIEIVAQLFRDESTNLDGGERKKLIERLLQFFLSEEWMSEYLRQKRIEIREATTSQVQNNIILSTSPLLNKLMLVLTFQKRHKRSMEEQEKKMEEAKGIASQLKVKAGEALALLSTGSQSNSDVIMNFSGCGDVLTEMLDSKITTFKCTISGNEILDILIKIECRISAAEILKHLCTHSTGDHTFHKMVLGKVLEELLHTNTTGTKPEAGNAITAGSASSPSSANDEENPRPPSSHQDDEPQIPGSNKQKSDKRRFQTALLSLYAAIRAIWTDAAEFARLLEELAGGDFVRSIKALIMENSYATPACLAMLKITCEMVALLVQHGRRYVEEFDKEKIIDALSEASEAVASLEGCMLFAGMDVDCYGVPLKPVSSVLVERAREHLNGNTTGAEENDGTPPAGRQ